MTFTFKVCFEGDVRRFSFDNQPGFSGLTQKLTELFNLVDPFVITYLDEVGDNITISSDEELEEAFFFLQETQQQILRLSVIPKINFNQFINNHNNKSNNNNPNNTNPNPNINNNFFKPNNNNNNNINGSGLDSLFVSLLSNQFVQQMIPQVINNLATNPALMTSLIQTTSTALRSNRDINNNSNNSGHNNTHGSSSNFHTSIDTMAILNSPNFNSNRDNNGHPILISVPVSSSDSNSKRNSTNLSASPSTSPSSTTSTNQNNGTSSSSSSPSSSTYSSLDAKSFEELSNSPKEMSPLATAITENSNANTNTTNTTTTNTTTNNKGTTSKSNPIFGVPTKIFNSIPFPFSGRSEAKKEEQTIVIQVPTPAPAYNVAPQQPYANHYSPSSSPKPEHHIHYPAPVPAPAPTTLYPPQHHPLSTSPSMIYQPPFPHQSTPIQQYHHQDQASILQQTYAPQPQPYPPLPTQQLPPQQQNQVLSNDKISILMDAFRIPEQKAKEMLNKHNGNIEEAIIMESE